MPRCPVGRQPETADAKDTSRRRRRGRGSIYPRTTSSGRMLVERVRLPLQFGARLRLRLGPRRFNNPASTVTCRAGCRIRTVHRPAAAVATKAKPRTATATNSAFLPSDYAKQPRINPLADNRSAAHSHCSKTISLEHTMFKLALGLLTALILASCAYAPTPTANVPSGVGHPDAYRKSVV